MAGTSWWSRLRRVPAPVVDAGLALALAVAVTAAIDVASTRGDGRAPGAYTLGLAVAALVLFRRRWTLAIVVWFVLAPLVYLLYQLWEGNEPLAPLLSGTMQSAAMFAAVVLFGEAVRSRRLLMAEQERSERLLLNVLPAPIAARLKQGEAVIADGFSEVTVLFADLVDFTRRSQQSTPAQVVQVLDGLFSALDRLAERHGLEKIKTIGDAYMAVGGLPVPRADHAEAVAEMALAVREEVGCGSGTGSSGGDRSRSRARANWSPGSCSRGTLSPAEAPGGSRPRTRPRTGR